LTNIGEGIERAANRMKLLEAHLKGSMQAGGYEHFVEQLRNAQRQAHNAIYVAEQLEKKVDELEAIDELTTNQAKEYLARAETAEAAVEQLEGALEAGQRNCDDAYDDLRAERDEAKRLAAQLAAQLADCAGYIASVRTDRQITREGDVYALQTLEWAEGAVEVAQYANAALEAYDKALNNGEAST